MFQHKAVLAVFFCSVIGLIIGLHLFNPSAFGETGAFLKTAGFAVAESSDAPSKTTKDSPAHHETTVHPAPPVEITNTSVTGATLTAAGKPALQRDWTFSDKAPQGDDASWRKPENLKIAGLVFYGRRINVSILQCYLKRNLVSNGGMLDEVIFLARTQNEEDLDWLDQLVASEPLYIRQDVSTYGGEYASSYDLIEDDVMYIKIDDDIVFFEDSTVSTLVHTLLTHPEYYLVTANIINQPSLSWVHQQLGAVRPYLPELLPQQSEVEMSADGQRRDLESDLREANQSSRVDWRASHLPTWSGPGDFSALDFESQQIPHRWLPLPIDANDASSYFKALERTPVMEASYDAFGPTLYHWTIAAQQHYSFLQHLENNEVWRYKFHIWDYYTRRLGIQFIAIMGHDINAAKPIEQDDEGYFSEKMPLRTKRHAVVDGRALAAHYSFGPQREGMETTDVLERYRSFAEENICMAEQPR